MEGDQHPKRAALRRLRASTIERLTDAFASDELGLEEFEARLNQAYAAEAAPEFAALVRDLSPASAAVQAPLTIDPGPGASLASPESLAGGQRTVAILSSVERRGHFSVARSSSALALLGSVVIDLREVSLAPGVTTLNVSAVLGSIEILVPPQLAVESQGVGILGSFEGMTRLAHEADPQLPVLRVVGRAVLGSIEIVTRPDDARMARGLGSKAAAPSLAARRK